MKKPEAIDPSKVIIIPRPPVAETGESATNKEAESSTKSEAEDAPKAESVTPKETAVKK